MRATGHWNVPKHKPYYNVGVAVLCDAHGAAAKKDGWTKFDEVSKQFTWECKHCDRDKLHSYNAVSRLIGEQRDMDTFDILKKYAEEKGIDAAKLEALLTAVADSEHIALKLMDGERVSSSETIRTILDIDGIEFHNAKATEARMIPIGKGVTGLFGLNDSGKTTAQLVARWIIGGAKATGMGFDEKMIRAGQEEMSGRLKFAGDNRYIARSISRRLVKKGKEAGTYKTERTLLVKLNGHEEDKLAKAQLEIDTYLGTDLAFVLSIAFLEQGQLTAMIDADPAVRKEAFYKLLGVGASEDTAKKLRAVLKRWTDTRAADVVNRVGYVNSIEQNKAKLTQIPPIDKLEAELARLAPVATAADETTAAQRGAIERRMAEIDADDVMKRHVSAEPIDVDKFRKAHNEQVAVVNALVASAEVLRAKYREVHALPDTCPVCAVIVGPTPDSFRRCDIPPEWKVGELARIREVGASKAKEAEAARDELANRERNAREAQEFETLRAQRIARQKMLGDEKARLKVQLDGLPAGATPDKSSVEAYAWAQAKVAEGRKIASDIEFLETRIAAIDADKGPLDEQLTGTEQRQLLEQAVAAFSKDGMPLWLARSHLGRVNELAREMGAGDRFTFAFGPDLDVQVLDTRQNMASIAPALASGSSRERGALILAAAMSRYQQELARIHCPLLWIDELPFQDEVNALQLADTAKRLTKWFDRVVLAASDWHLYEGKFDHEVWLSQPLDDAAKSRAARVAANGGASLPPPDPVVKTYDSQVDEDAAKVVDATVTGTFTEPPTPAMVPKPGGTLTSDIAALRAKLGVTDDPGF